MDIPSRITPKCLALIASACASMALAQSAPTGQPDAARAASLGLPTALVIPEVPAFREERLALIDLPKPAGRAISLFNGRDLSAFTPWLGYPSGKLIPVGDEKPLGAAGLDDVFKVVDVDGRPAIFVSGRLWGSINTRRDFANYHLSLSFKFGRQLNPAVVPNTGVLFHSFGPEGAFYGTWMKAVEFEIAKNMTGMMIPVGPELRIQSSIGKTSDFGGYGGGPSYRFMVGGKATEIRMPTQIYQARDAEHAYGEWNRLDLYAVGDRAVYVINGIPVGAASAISLVGADGVSTPLTHGRIQLQSEGTEVYYRDIQIAPIRSVPRIVLQRGRSR